MTQLESVMESVIESIIESVINNIISNRGSTYILNDDWKDEWGLGEAIK